MITTTRILLFNIGYCTELNGGVLDYVLHWYRYICTPKRVLQDAAQRIESLIADCKPDICCFAEVHRRSPIVRWLRRFWYSTVGVKYAPWSMMAHMPALHDNCNGVFTHRHLPVQTHYLPIGAKRLVYEVQLDHKTSLFVVHCALGRGTRKIQLQELASMIKQCGREAILCGDFNVFGGRNELHALMKECNLRIVNPHGSKTFPAVHPTSELDLFLCTSGIRSATAHVLQEVQVSDHLPVMLEVKLKH